MKTHPPWHMGRPRRQLLVPWPCPSPLLVLLLLHRGNTWGTHRRHSSVVSHKGTHTNGLVNRIGHCGGARFNYRSTIYCTWLLQYLLSPTVKFLPSKLWRKSSNPPLRRPATTKMKKRSQACHLWPYPATINQKRSSLQQNQGR